jgi:hypothetical protein
MRRLLNLFVAALLAFAPAAHADLRASGVVGVSGVRYDAAKWGVPFIVASTGTMANNCAITLGTALPTTYSGGAWVLLPAGAVAAGVPAAATWFWSVWSSSTQGTCFNSTYTSGVPTLGTQTAFATTGPGAFTGVTAETTGPTITIPANVMGPSGRIDFDYTAQATNNASSKTIKVKHATGIVYQTLAASVSTVGDAGWIQNAGATNVQTTGNIQAIAADTVGSLYAVVDTTTAQTVSWTYTNALATNNLVHVNGRVSITPGP